MDKQGDVNQEQAETVLIVDATNENVIDKTDPWGIG